MKSYKRELFDAYIHTSVNVKGRNVSAPHTFFSVKIRSIVLGEIFALKNDYLGILADQHCILFPGFTHLDCTICMCILKLHHMHILALHHMPYYTVQLPETHS
jgi:hypothetical protein